MLITIKQSSLDAYIGLDDAPGVGQANVSLRAKQLQAFLQVALCILVNLHTKRGKRSQSCGVAVAESKQKED